MVDFGALMGDAKRDDTVNPISIFDELPKMGAVHDLYKVQAEILETWFKKRNNHKDIVVELNTGGGKTLVGLLIALSTARETKKGVLYLVENKQLVSQAIEQAAQIGIPVISYTGRNSLNADFDNGSAILVGAFQALFNGKSVFGVKGMRAERAQLGGIIIDDAHASLGALREVFSLVVPADEEAAVYRRILAVLKDAFDALNKTHSYEELYEGIGSHIVEIPYEYWRTAEGKVVSALFDEGRARSDCDDAFSQALKFNWPLIKDNLKYCQVVVSRKRISITAMYPLLQMIPSFGDAERRVYMSATITDYGDMVRAYDLRELKEDAIIAPKTVSGVGRRMILFPSAEQLNSNEFNELVHRELDKHYGIVKLASNSNTDLAKRLSCYEPIGNGDVIAAVKSLRRQECTHPVSFVNRYNGIDLPDDACRILILDDLPIGGDDLDIMFSSYLPESGITAQRIAQKIEQGIGRGVRGASDHCVVLIVGHRLIDWMKRDKNRKYFSPPLQAQIRMGLEICDAIHTPIDFCEAINQELTSEGSWVDYHAKKLVSGMSEPRERFDGTFKSACVERRAFSLWVEGHQGNSVGHILKQVSLFDDDASYQGWLLNMASRIAYDNGDKAEAREYARRAHSLNQTIDVVEGPYAPDVPDWAIAQARALLQKISSLSGTSVLAMFDCDMAGLIFGGDSGGFEASMQLLGSYLGFDSSCEDQNGEGPDVCWVDPLHRLGWAIEVKSKKERSSLFHKKEAGQLRTARDWMLQKYPGIAAEAVSVHPTEVADPNASASNLKVLKPDSLESLKQNVRLLLDEVGTYVDASNEAEIAHLITIRRMGLEDLARDYLVPFETRGGCELRSNPIW